MIEWLGRRFDPEAFDAAKVKFDIERVGIGGNAVTILYRNHRGDHVAETLVFNGDRKVVEGVVTYL